MQWWHIFQSAQMNFECLWEVQNICVIYCSLPLLFLFHKMKEEVGGEAGMLIRNIISFQIFPWGFQMENIFFLYSSKVLLFFLSAVKPTFPIYFYFDKFITIFLQFCCSLSILLSSNSFWTAHLIQMKESSITRPISAMRRDNLYKELIELTPVLVPRQKLITTVTATWKYYTF